MALKVPNVGELLLLEWAVKETSTPENWTLKLYQNDYTPTDADTAASYTECDFGGYASEALARGSWNDPTTNGSGKAEITFGSELSWDATDAQTVYGYYVVGATSGTLIYAERFASARDLDNGLSLAFTPKLTLSSES